MSFSRLLSLAVGPPSWLGHCAVAGVLLALVAVLLSALPMVLKMLLCLLVPALAYWQWQRLPRGRLHVRAHQLPRLDAQNPQHPDRWQTLETFRSCWLTSALLLLECRPLNATRRARFWLLVARNANDADTWRRLRVLLLWRGQGAPS